MGAAVFKFHSGYIYTKGTTKEATITAFFKFHSGYIYTITNPAAITAATTFKFHSGYIYTGIYYYTLFKHI